jgi:hypothetical protein
MRQHFWTSESERDAVSAQGDGGEPLCRMASLEFTGRRLPGTTQRSPGHLRAFPRVTGVDRLHGAPARSIPLAVDNCRILKHKSVAVPAERALNR